MNVVDVVVTVLCLGAERKVAGHAEAAWAALTPTRDALPIAASAALHSLTGDYK